MVIVIYLREMRRGPSSLRWAKLCHTLLLFLLLLLKCLLCKTRLSDFPKQRTNYLWSLRINGGNSVGENLNTVALIIMCVFFWPTIVKWKIYWFLTGPFLRWFSKWTFGGFMILWPGGHQRLIADINYIQLIKTVLSSMNFESLFPRENLCVDSLWLDLQIRRFHPSLQLGMERNVVESETDNLLLFMWTSGGGHPDTTLQFQNQIANHVAWQIMKLHAACCGLFT